MTTTKSRQAHAGPHLVKLLKVEPFPRIRLVHLTIYFNIHLIYMYNTYQNKVLQWYTRHICIITVRIILVKDSSKTRNTTNQYFNNMLENDLAEHDQWQIQDFP